MKLGLGVLICVAMGLAACGEAPTPSEEPALEEMTDTQPDLPEPTTTQERFARLALDCIHRPYPNKISHVLESDADIATPQEMTPVFYGCFDWHSSVHGHWLLVRTLKTQGDTAYRAPIIAALNESFTAEKMAGEIAYYTPDHRAGFERPYGIAWYLQLVAELDESEDPQLSEWRETLRPLEEMIVARVKAWLPKLSYPVRLGTHNQTAFAFGLMLDYARQVGDTELETALIAKSVAFHLQDTHCPLNYEPSGEDFLSPCLMEADLMRRVLPRAEYASWLTDFLPDLPTDGSGDWLAPGIVLDPSDGKLVHLDGVNLSRAWALEGIAAALEETDPRRASLLAAAELHTETGIAAVSDAHYSGSHWLASFATYLTTQRGITGAGTPE
ncbi:MAG: DUF2891 domain-containing protein [Hyphomonadaceae bacterium]|nr:DUF2891 domain-containing protein [Hyphomonadaceae bacterium]